MKNKIPETDWENVVDACVEMCRFIYYINKSVDDKNVINVMRKITKKIFVHISQTDNIIILIMSLLKHMLKILPVIDSIPVIDCDTIPIDREISDHDGTYVSIDGGYCNRKTFQRTIWDYKRGDYLLMKNKIPETRGIVFQYILLFTVLRSSRCSLILS
jgi:hypothetical protein